MALIPELKWDDLAHTPLRTARLLTQTDLTRHSFSSIANWVEGMRFYANIQ